MDAALVALRYEQGFWNKQMVKMAVRKGIITNAQYEEIINGLSDCSEEWLK